MGALCVYASESDCDARRDDDDDDDGLGWAKMASLRLVWMRRSRRRVQMAPVVAVAVFEFDQRGRRAKIVVN